MRLAFDDQHPGLEVVPELEALLGPQPAVSELGPIETQIRLRSLLVGMVRQIAAAEHPLVLFLDDLQWADQPSLEFIGTLLEESDLNGLMLIGAYRDNEVDAAHPLMRLLRPLRQPTAPGTGEPPTVLHLDNLTVVDLTDLLSDMLHTPSGAVQPLAGALYAKTEGNIFFAVEYLNALIGKEPYSPMPKADCGAGTRRLSWPGR
ncbi:ATP-binding protein [Rhodoferax antarcticus]|uniref:ATP-binding protein n=1 Tax=Rhodoferax antarcticus TaxID=81479 RepID=UPI002224DF1C|nr:AAA family ATPase [Rhodoferax antarcticus]MCW2312171.1 putative ATPase [Rhodoferax antarcticus]